MPIEKVAELKRKKAICSIRAKLLAAAREWFKINGFMEVQGPIIIPALGEQPSSFAVKYFDKKAYLGHGLQPYSDTFVKMFQKIYTVSPVFRAEKVISNRHLCEYWHIEVASSKCDLKGIMSIQEGLLESICHFLAKEAKEEIELLDQSSTNLEKIRSPFRRLSYDEAVQLLQNEGEDIQWGGELTWPLEEKLSADSLKPFFIANYPISVENSFFKVDPERPELSLVADLIAPGGYGEIASCGQMINKKNYFVKRMQEEEIGSRLQNWFNDLKSFSSVPTSGFALGVERMTQWICGLEKVQDTVAFPRDYKRSYP
jgi:asparaginyl-tRNA synthetase